MLYDVGVGPAAIRKVSDPALRARRAEEALAAMLPAQTELRRIRDEAIREAVAGGASLTDLGKRLGLTKGRIFQIVNGQ